jgi:hypothetical protein
VMRGFGRSCRGQGRVFVKLVRHTEQRLLDLGESIQTYGRQAQERLEQTTALHDPQRERLPRELTMARRAHAHLRTPSKRLTQGKKLPHCTVVNAYDPTIAPMMKGKRHGPAQFGRKPGIVSAPATGCLFANLTPKGHPSDLSSVLPFLDQVQEAIERVETGPKRHIHSVAGDLGLNDAVLRQALHERCILSVGIAKTIEPLAPNPSAQEVLDMLHEAGVHRKRTPHHVH